MDNPIYVALSSQMILRRQLEVVANNIANADTAGFKVETLITNTDAKPLPNQDGGPKKINYVLDTGVARDFAQGSLSQTGGALDVAVEGDGFFKISTARGERYTRDGRFALDAQGKLVTKGGDAVQGDGGDITIDSTKGELSIARDGTLSQGTTRLGKLDIVSFDDRSGLSKEGGSLYAAKAGSTPQAVPDAVVHQAMVESSNVQPILQITNMIEVSRAYERLSRIIDQTAELDRQSIGRLGRIAA